MLYPRIYSPKKNEIVYHYCSPYTFQAICANRTIRFSDLSSMNDFLEVHWGDSIWKKTIKQVENDVQNELLVKMNEIIDTARIEGGILASCFSMKGDVLSQWRAYADDGRGFSIGFKATEILHLPVRSLKVQYNERKQIKETVALIKAINEAEQSEDDKYGENFTQSCLSLAYDLAAFKNPAFAEEQEVRFTHILFLKKSNKSRKLVDFGGNSFGKPQQSYGVQFRMSGSLPIPYIDIDYSNNRKINPIIEVILGPKNNASETAISTFLETLDIGNVTIKKSLASYR